MISIQEMGGSNPLKSINLPPFADERGSTSLLVCPESMKAIIKPTLHIGVDTAAGAVVMQHLVSGEVYLTTPLTKEETMAAASCLLNKLYFLRGGFAP